MNALLCRAVACHSDDECNKPFTESDKACCYNGCVHTCVVKLKPAPFFDWDDSDDDDNEQGNMHCRVFFLFFS